MKCALRFVCRLACGRLWPLMLAVLIYVLPVIYMYLTFQCHWHDWGALLNIINNLFERGYFYSYDWDLDHLNVHFTPFFYVLSPFVHLSRSLFFYVLLHALVFATSAWVYHQFAKEVLRSSSLAGLCYFTLVVNPYFMAGNLYTHFEAFMALFLLSFALFAVRGKFWLALLCLMIALKVKEDVWIYGITASVILLGRTSTKHVVVYVNDLYYILRVSSSVSLSTPVPKHGQFLSSDLGLRPVERGSAPLSCYPPLGHGEAPHHRFRWGLQPDVPLSADAGGMAVLTMFCSTLSLGQCNGL
jgi:Predicted membrane protein (DUF2079)